MGAVFCSTATSAASRCNSPSSSCSAKGTASGALRQLRQSCYGLFFELSSLPEPALEARGCPAIAEALQGKLADKTRFPDEGLASTAKAPPGREL